MWGEILCIVSRWPSLADWASFPTPQLAQFDLSVLTLNINQSAYFLCAFQLFCDCTMNNACIILCVCNHFFILFSRIYKEAFSLAFLSLSEHWSGVHRNCVATSYFSWKLNALQYMIFIELFQTISLRTDVSRRANTYFAEFSEQSKSKHDICVEGKSLLKYQVFLVSDCNMVMVVFLFHLFSRCVLGRTLNCIHIEWCPGHDVKLHPHFIVTGIFLYWFVMRPASQHFFIHNCIHLRILIISNLVTFLGTNSFSVLICRKAVNQSINVQQINVKKEMFILL